MFVSACGRDQLTESERTRRMRGVIAGAVASMTEDEPDLESEISSDNALGSPGQHYEVGRVFGCLV